jgi:23S rRNA pseudouridine1911/1915/1917 synthase
MSQKAFVVESGGMRLDRYLAENLPDYSRSHLKGLIARGCVTVGGRPRPADYKVRPEERIVLAFPDQAWPQSKEFAGWIMHEDKHLIVLNKPAGLLMHPLGESWLCAPQAALAEAQANLAGLLLSLRPEISRSGVARTGIVHRLDRQTSGVLLVAKTPAAYRELVEGFKERRITKFYRAVVRGVPAGKTVQAPIGRNPGHRRVVVTPFGKSAETAFSVVEACRGGTLVEARPLTGRTHQIRAHLGFMGTPVMGDAEFDQKKKGLPWPPRMLLHAYRIELKHPGTGKPVQYTAPLPKDFRRFWRELKKGGGS